MARKGDASPYGKPEMRRGAGWQQRESSAGCGLSERGERRAAAQSGPAGWLAWPVLAGASSCPSLLPWERKPGHPPPSAATAAAEHGSGFSAERLRHPPPSLPLLSQACCCVLDEVGNLGAEAPRRERGENSWEEPLLPLPPGSSWLGLEG